MIPIYLLARWLAVVTSAVLLVTLWASDELAPSHAFVLLGWFLVAVYCQFFGGSAGMTAAGLALQTVLAICLVLQMKLRL